MKYLHTIIWIIFILIQISCNIEKNVNYKGNQLSLKIIGTDDLLYVIVKNNTKKNIVFNAASDNNRRFFFLESLNKDSSVIKLKSRQVRYSFINFFKNSPYYFIEPYDSIEFQINTICNVKNISGDSCIVKLVYDFNIPFLKNSNNKEAIEVNNYIKKNNIWVGYIESNELIVTKEVLLNYCGNGQK